MKIPHKTTGNISPSTRTLGYFEDNSAVAARGLQAFAGALGGLGSALEQHQQKTEAFAAEEAWSQFEQDLNERTVLNARETEPNDSTYIARSEEMFDNLSGQMISKLPPAQQEAFRARVASKKTAYLANTIKYDFEQKDAWYRQGVSQSVVTSLNSIDKDWTNANVDAQIAGLDAKIDATNLSEAEKAEQKLKIREVALQAQLKKSVATNTYEGKPISENKGATSTRAKQLAFVVHELNGTEAKAGQMLKNAKTLHDAVAAGISYERPQGWRPDSPSSGHGFNQRLKYAQQVLAGKATPQAMQARAYFEEQGFTPIQASGMVGNLMQESGANLNPAAIRKNDAGPGNHSVGIGQWNRDRLAAYQKFSGESGDIALPDANGLEIMDDPRFAMLPPEQRQALIDDGLAIRARQQKLAEDAQKKEHDNFINETLIGIQRGSVGKADVETLLDQRAIDFGEYSKMQGVFKERENQDKDLREGLELLGQNRPPSDGQFNTVVKETGIVDRLWQGDWSAVDQVMGWAANGSGVAPIVRGDLISMSLGNDPKKALFGLKALSRIRDASYEAYQMLPDSARQRVEAFRLLTETMSDDAALGRLNGGTTPDERMKIQNIRDTGIKIFESSKIPGIGMSGGELALDKLNDYLSPWLAENPTMGANFASYDFVDWYKTNWVENYTLTGDAAKATELTDIAIPMTWAVSNAGGQPQFMKNAPETIGLPQFEGSYDWLYKQVLDTFKLPEGSKVHFVADELTRTQIANWRAGGMKFGTGIDLIKKGLNGALGREYFNVTAPEPTWEVIQIGGDYGVKHLGRVGFRPTEELRQRDEDIFRLESDKSKAPQIYALYDEEMKHSAATGKPPNPSIVKAWEDLNAGIEAESTRLYGSPKPPEKRKAYDPRKDRRPFTAGPSFR